MSVKIGFRRPHPGVVIVTALAVAALAVVAALSSTHSAQAASFGSPYSIALSGADGNFFYNQANTSLAVNQGKVASGSSWDEQIQLDVYTGNNNLQYSFVFGTAPGSGTRLATGYYRWALQNPANGSGRPLINVTDYASSVFCDTSDSGSFEIRDIHRQGSVITRTPVR